MLIESQVVIFYKLPFRERKPANTYLQIYSVKHIKINNALSSLLERQNCLTLVQESGEPPFSKDSTPGLNDLTVFDSSLQKSRF